MDATPRMTDGMVSATRGSTALESGAAESGGAEYDDGMISITAAGGAGGAEAAVVGVRLSCVREHQALMIQDRLVGVAERTGGRVVVSLEGVEDVTSAFIGALVEAGARCRALGGRLVVFGADRELGRVLRLIRSAGLVWMARDRASALKLAGAAAPGRGLWRRLRRAA